MLNKAELLSPYARVLASIGSVADVLGIQAFVIGGFVRDLFLARVSNDIDIVCIGDVIEFAGAVAKKYAACDVAVYKNFGTAMLSLFGYKIEFVGARKESYRNDSRKPFVVNGTLHDDQMRRDFTMNTLAISINKDSWGDFLDPFNGLKDLEQGIIRTPNDDGSKTFFDDPLRMLRAVRFAMQLNMSIAEETFNDIKCQKHRLNIVSKERICVELNKIMECASPASGLNLLDNVGILEFILPELIALKGNETIHGFSHKDNFEHSLLVLDNVAEKSNNLWLRWAALLHDIAKPCTKKFDPNIGFSFHGHEFLGPKIAKNIFHRLKLPLDYRLEYVQRLIRLHLRPIALVEDVVTDSAIRRLIFEAGDDLNDLFLLCRADITSRNQQKINQYLANFEKIEQKIAEIEDRDKIKNFQPAISGNDIILKLGLYPSPIVGKIKNAIKNAVLDGLIENNYDQAEAYMFEVYDAIKRASN